MLITTTKLEPRVKRTRQLLQEAMIGLLREQSFHKVSVQDIAERAEVNRATFYDHFDDKYELLNTIVRDRFQQSLESKLTDTPSFTLDNLRLLTLTVCEYMGEFLGHCSPDMHQEEQAVMMRQVQVKTYEVILEWITTSAHRPIGLPVSSVEVVAMVTSSAIFGSALQWVLNDRKRMSPEELTDQVLALLTVGLEVYLSPG